MDKEALRKFLDFVGGVAKNAKLPEAAQPADVLTQLLNQFEREFGLTSPQPQWATMANSEGLSSWQHCGVISWDAPDDGKLAVQSIHKTSGARVAVSSEYALKDAASKTFHQNWSDREAYIAIGEDKVELRKWLDDMNLKHIDTGKEIGTHLQRAAGVIEQTERRDEEQKKRQLVRNGSDLAKDFAANEQKSRKNPPPVCF